MTSHLVIDASTQPGPFIGAGRAKVVLLLPAMANGLFDVFAATNASDLAIYGFSIKGQLLRTAWNGTYFTNCTDVHIGDNTRGNVFFGLGNGIAAIGAKLQTHHHPPNGDGIHDQWHISYEGAVTDFTVAVYKPLGQEPTGYGAANERYGEFGAVDMRNNILV